MNHQKLIEILFPFETRRRGLYDLASKGLRAVTENGIKEALCRFNEYRHSHLRIKIDKKQYILDLFNRAGKKSPEYVPLSSNYINLKEDDIKIVTFYLPQYHPIPENDAWWGKGFTDWRNVAKAVPQFAGHYQPKVPDELGFYDLRVPEVLKRQVELAGQYGIYGFCFHYYWFNGRRLLEKPLNQFLDNRELNLKFCICWANENWTRRWDGLESEILIDQAHSVENDIAFIKDMEPIFNDPRYIRIKGKPLLIIYRVGILPDAKKTAERWREYAVKHGMGEIYLVAAQGFGFSDPRTYGFDAAVEFPPHTIPNTNIANPLFSKNIYNYKYFVKSKTYLKGTPYKLFKAVFPGWDNTARRPNSPSIFYGSNPATYKEWLLNVSKFSKDAHNKEERFIFINAWNEWAEGAYLEPDLKYGYGNLQATAEVILDCRQ